MKDANTCTAIHIVKRVQYLKEHTLERVEDKHPDIDENQSEPLTPEEAYLRLKQLVEQ